jgi:hypothetical protein
LTAETVYRVIESERLPHQVGPQEFHYSNRFQMAAMACPCGCGHRILLNLADQHALEVRRGRPTVTPSILVADARCLSHFWLTDGRVIGAEKWSAAEVQDVMAAQLERHLEAATVHPLPWWRRTLRAVRRLLPF